MRRQADHLRQRLALAVPPQPWRRRLCKFAQTNDPAGSSGPSQGQPPVLNHAQAVLAPGSPAVPALRRAVEQGLVAVSDAAKVVRLPGDIQTKVLYPVVRGASRNLARVARQIAAETVEREAAILGPNQRTNPMERPTFHECTVGQLHSFVDASTVDTIITHPPLSKERLPLFSDLADFTVHALSITTTVYENRRCMRLHEGCFAS